MINTLANNPMFNGVSMTAITKKYCTQIIESNGEMIADDVPSLWRNKVKKAFADMLALGNITEEQYNTYMGIVVESDDEEEEAE